MEINQNLSVKQHKQKRNRELNKYRGAYYDSKLKKYRCTAVFAYKRYYFGYFENEIEAAQIYDIAAKKFYGKSSCLNFPDNQSDIPKKLIDYAYAIIDYCDGKTKYRPHQRQSSTGYRGVIRLKNGKFKVTIWHKKPLFLGWFDDPSVAARIYDQYAIKYHGDKAKLNFPQ
jgi:hypothetical protein